MAPFKYTPRWNIKIKYGARLQIKKAGYQPSLHFPFASINKAWTNFLILIRV